MFRRCSLLLSTAAFAVPLLWGSSAQAGLESCGNIHVEASAECEVVAGVECEAMCEPVNLRAQCAGDLFYQCKVPDRCVFEASASCTGTCQTDCMASCQNFEAGSFDCRGECYGRCEGSCTADCSGRCSAEPNSAECEAQCRASCEGTCEGECSASCEGTPPMADCAAQCEGSCQGSCEAEANFDCQIECQRPSFDGCTAELSGGCKAECDSEGALFCDSDYVDHGNNLEDCVASLRAALNIMVEGYAEGSCEAGSCEGEAGFSCTCSASDERDEGMGWALLALSFGLVGLGRRRRRAA